MLNDWEVYTPEGKGMISLHFWGKDHWSTLAYLETVITDKKGIIDNRKMRCNPRLHRELANVGLGGVIDGGKYPTRLKGGKLKRLHDDWSCLEDMVADGLIIAAFRVTDSGEVFGNSEALVKFTPLGEKIASKLRSFKAGGGNYQDFDPGFLSLKDWIKKYQVKYRAGWLFITNDSGEESALDGSGGRVPSILRFYNKYRAGAI